MATASLWLTIAFLLTHELDAVLRREWRILPLTSFLSDATGRQVFIWAHVPLVLVVLWIAAAGPGSVLAIGFCLFAILHIGLHWLFRNHPENRFANPASRLLIWLPGVTGAWHLGQVL